MNTPFQKVSVATAVAAILGTAAVHPSSAVAAEQQTLDTLAEVTVTGSRIVRRDFVSPSPVVTVGSETLEQSSTQAVESMLNQLPQFVPSQTMFSAGDVQPSAFNNPGIVTLNLRGLGANRNLVLVDGRRAQPANALLLVDINSIPSAAIESVEIISGGASAVYGADAMGGVTNFKMKRDFQGLSLNAQTMLTEAGGGQESSLSVLLGGNFADGRGNAMVGLSYTDRKALMASERKFYVNGWRDPDTLGGEALPFSQIDFGNNSPDEAVYTSIFGARPGFDGEAVYVNRDGTLFLNSATNPGIGYSGPINDEFKVLGAGTANAGAVAANNLNQSITTPLERYSVFANAHFDINDHVTAFVQANMSSMRVDTVLTYAPATSQWSASVPADGRAVPAELQQLLASRPDPAAPYTLNRTLDFAGPRATSNETDMFQVLAGIEGRVFNTGWRYEGYFSHGETSLLTEMSGFPGLQNYRAVVAAENFGANLIQSVGPPLFFELKCTSGLPVFEHFEPSRDCLDSISGNMKHSTGMKQDVAEVNLTGELFALPAGTIGSAFGASWRKNSYQWRPDDQLTRPSTNFPIGLFPTSRTGGETRVSELYGELLLPILSGVPGFRQFNLELGARWSDYNTAGSIWTYKGLVDWTIVDSVRLRGGYQLANRAPNVAELFTGATTSVVGFQGADPCMANTANDTWGNHPNNTTNRTEVIGLCSDLINRSRGDVNQSPWHTNPNFPNNIVGPFPFPFQLELANITGNPALRNEEAKTWTVGMVLTSPWEGLFGNATLAVDWYQVKITDAIAPTSPWSVYAKCLNQDGSNPAYDVENEWCRLITRDNDGYRATVDTPYYNLGGIETAGIDVQLNWSFPAGPGRIGVNAVVNFLDYYRDQVSPDDPFIDSTGTLLDGGQFDYRTFNTVTYSQGAWSAGLRHRYLPSIKSASYATDPGTTIQGASSYNMLDAFGSVRINDTISLRGGIDNLLDLKPRVTGRDPGTNESAGTTAPQYYDVLGRRFFLSVQVDL